MNKYDYEAKKRCGWPVHAEVKVYSCDLFMHGGEVHTSDDRIYFFKTDEEAMAWVSKNGSRARGDGPIKVLHSVSDWLYSKRPAPRCIEEMNFDNPDFNYKEYRKAYNESQG